jgi:hypothetical protein
MDRDAAIAHSFRTQAEFCRASQCGFYDEKLTACVSDFEAGGVIADLLSGWEEETTVPIYHWGDIDVGGLRIFLHLERSLAAVGRALQPHLRSGALLETHGTASSRPGWVRSVRPPLDSALESLCRAIEARGMGLELEQEAVAPTAPSNAKPPPNSVETLDRTGSPT